MLCADIHSGMSFGGLLVVLILFLIVLGLNMARLRVLVVIVLLAWRFGVASVSTYLCGRCWVCEWWFGMVLYCLLSC